MKFGKNLAKNQVPGFSSHYLPYKSLKKLIGNAQGTLRQTQKLPDLTPIFYELDRSVEDVEDFYQNRVSEIIRKVRVLEQRYQLNNLRAIKSKTLNLHIDEWEDLITTLVELRSQLQKLSWYAEVNKRGFVKITKKLDKKLNVSEQTTYLESKVLSLSFASRTDVVTMLDQINDWLSLLEAADPVSSSSLLQSPGLRDNTTAWGPSFTDKQTALLEQCLKSDDINLLAELAEQLSQSCSQNVLERWYVQFLHRALLLRAKKCVEFLLQTTPSMKEQDELNSRNLIHKFLVTFGRMKKDEVESSEQSHTKNFEPFYITPAQIPKPTSLLSQISTTSFSGFEDDSYMLETLLQNLPKKFRFSLLEKDTHGRTPLHYAAQYGLDGACRIILKYLSLWDLEAGGSLRTWEKFWQDSEGMTPFHLAIDSCFVETVSVLTKAPSLDVLEGSALVDYGQTNASPLEMASSRNHHEIVTVLLECFNINERNKEGETPLYVAVRSGSTDAVRALLVGTDLQKADLEIIENTFGWTALIHAAVDGNEAILQLLKDAGANLNHIDLSGWTAMEHAVFRGHIQCGRLIRTEWQTAQSSNGESTPIEPSKTVSNSSSSLDSNMSWGEKKPSASESIPIRSYGHRYLKDEMLLLVTLGSMNIEKHLNPVELDRVPLTRVSATRLDTALSIVIYAHGASGGPYVFDLPIDQAVNTDPIAFHNKNLSNVQINFDIIPTYSAKHDELIARAVGLVRNFESPLGSSKELLQSGHKAPVLSAQNLEVVGSVNFEVQVVKPFSHPKMSIEKTSTYWKSLTTTKVIGHRGLGKNLAERRSLQLGENTLQSFISAASLGASYVEFDVQLTKDLVPVIYHDFLVSETGVDAPLHSLTLEQFMAASSYSVARNPMSAHNKPRHRKNADLDGLSHTDGNSFTRPDVRKLRHRTRSVSLENISDEQETLWNERIKYTRDFKKKNLKGNTRGHAINGPFATLREVLTAVPRHVGLNIECKYPMRSEAEDEEMENVGIDLNKWVDTVLDTVYEYGHGRDIIFSSFHPDICLMLSMKQPSIPILFLTEAGTSPMKDVRATSLQQAIRFATNWNLLGIVTACEPVILCPRFIKTVKESGLVCFSYGLLNNDTKNVKVQVNAGVDAVIVDSVLEIRKGLQEG